MEINFHRVLILYIKEKHNYDTRNKRKNTKENIEKKIKKKENNT